MYLSQNLLYFTTRQLSQFCFVYISTVHKLKLISLTSVELGCTSTPAQHAQKMNRFNQQIISINIDNKQDNLLKLEEIIRANEPIACLLQDVPQLSKNHLIDTCKAIASHYEITLNQEHLEQRKRIDNLILTHRERVQLRELHIYNSNSKASSIGVSLTRVVEVEDGEEDETSNVEKEHGKLVLFSVYIRPRATHYETKACLDWILDRSKSSYGHCRTIVMGDMNASEAMWCPIESTLNNKENSDKHYKQIKLVRGRLVAKHFSKMNLTCLNKIELGPTYEHAQGSSYIDLAFVGNKAIRTWKTLSLEKLWELPAHKALILEARGSAQARYKKKTYKRIRLELLSESLFEEVHLQCDSLCTNWRQLPRDRIIKRMDRITSVLYRAIYTAQLKITTRITRKLPIKGTNHGRGVLNARVRHQIRRLRKCQSKIARLRHKLKGARNTSNDIRMVASSRPNLYSRKRALKQKGAKLRRDIINSMNANNLTEQYGDLRNSELWDKVHIMQNLIDNARYNINNTDQFNNNIKSKKDIDELARVKFPHRFRGTLNYVDNAYKESPASIRIKVTEEEIMAAVSDLRNKSYTSAEGIKMSVFYRSLEFVADIVKTLIEMSFWVCYAPKKACSTLGTLIPKKAAGQFRIVHVSSPMAALLELIAIRRLEYRLEQYKLNSPYQFGFSALISRHDLMARLLEFFYKEYLEVGMKASGLIISLDIEGAFDNVNQDRLIEGMDRELGNDPIKYWLASFVLNRRISIKKGSLQSNQRDICLGVPQGSALGPVLWNFMIHDIDQDIASPGKAELIRYADDIILVYNGDDKNLAQFILDKLVNKLNCIDLNIRPEKCSVMGVRLGYRDQRRNEYHIRGTPINKVNRMNILGIPITNKLKLDRSSAEHIEKFNISLKKLCNINRIGLINTAEEWRILIESYLKNRLIINNWPILIIDTDSCNWVDKQMIKSLRIIFGWPNNTSVKLIKLITGTLGCRELVVRTAKLRALTEFKCIYEFLLKISQTGTIQEILAVPFRERVSRGLITRRVNLETDIIRNRKHPDPSKLLMITEIEDFQEIVERHGSTWILLDRNMGSMLAEINERQEVKQIKLGRHSQYPISYFNSFALILKTITDRTCNCRSITLSEKSSILSALENTHNRDWRVIQLRERMADNGWKINKIRHNIDRRLRESLAIKYQNLALRHDTNTIINDFNLWLAMNEEATEERAVINTRPLHKVESLSEPFLLDYRRRNHINKWAPKEDDTFFQGCHTSITSALTTKTSIWQSMTPNWLDGSRMLVLSGMTNNEHGQLTYGEREPSDTCNLCTQQQYNDNTELSTSSDWHGIDRNKIKSNLVLHRTFACKKFNLERAEFLKRTKTDTELDTSNAEDKETLETILSNRRTCQRLLSLMVKCNMLSN